MKGNNSKFNNSDKVKKDLSKKTNKFEGKEFKIDKTAKNHARKVMKRNDSLLKRLKNL